MVMGSEVLGLDLVFLGGGERGAEEEPLSDPDSEGGSLKPWNSEEEDASGFSESLSESESALETPSSSSSVISMGSSSESSSAALSSSSVSSSVVISMGSSSR